MIETDIRKLLPTLTIETRRSCSQQFRNLGLHIGQEVALCELWE